MKKNILFFLFIGLLGLSCKSKENKKVEIAAVRAEKVEKKVTVKITPVTHATAVLEFDNQVIYIDPVGGADAFKNFNKPTYILITDIHGDHMDIKTLETLDLLSAEIIAPQAVADKISGITTKKIIILNNGEEKDFESFKVTTIPMYNLREEALKFHPKGRGNGYVLTINEERIYFSGDTEDIPEMRSLQNIDKAFVCMNLPYTMTVESAASAVLAFTPKQVYPYHYRGTDGKSDVAKFKELITKENADIEVVQLNWYP